MFVVLWLLPFSHQFLSTKSMYFSHTLPLSISLSFSMICSIDFTSPFWCLFAGSCTLCRYIFCSFYKVCIWLACNNVQLPCPVIRYNHVHARLLPLTIVINPINYPPFLCSPFERCRCSSILAAIDLVNFSQSITLS